MYHVFNPSDVISGPALVIGGTLAAAIALGVAVVAEALVLLALRWAPLLRSARDALIVNMASGIVGIVLAVVFASPLLASDSGWPIAVGSWALSVVIEGAILQRLGQEQPAWRPWTFALIMNVVSYGLFFGLGAALGSF
ncbi:MAG TPA: hypothetical protein VNL77_18325 [Roseiflexaceae bacterium]|nr:hypothetical protein [Roseiflexaceae bacterium]